jgi:arginase
VGATHVVDVPLEAGDERGTGIPRFGSLAMVRERTLEVLSSLPDIAITIGGDCSVDLAGVEHANTRSEGDLAVVWFDAHPDLNTAESSPSGAFAGMVLRALVGDGPLTPDIALDPTRIVVAGARAFDDAEEEYIAAAGIRTVGVVDLESPDELVAAVAATGAASVYIHIDVDVIDPAEFGGKSDPVPFGITAAELVAAIRSLRQNFTLAGAAITEFAPASPEAAIDDLPTILRLIGALTAPLPQA